MDDNRSEIVVFDFDGTLTTRDSFLVFIRYARGTHSYWRGMLECLPQIILYGLHLISNETLKQHVFGKFFSGMPYEDFCEKAREFSLSCIDGFARKETVEILHEYVAVGHKVLIVSASVPEWIQPWASRHGVSKVLGTEIEVSEQGTLTGRLSTKNCYGAEKVRRFLEECPYRSSYKLTVYGDSRGDRELMSLADESFLIAPPGARSIR
ncbi:MAG: HAD-IB family hydrolase [Prevotella sp.]|nr:HAD-IB family hydrolase [Prevotella sp.]